MSEPLPFGEIASQSNRPGAQTFAARINRSSGWAICVVVGDQFFHTAPTMTEGDARGTAQVLRRPESTPR